MTIFKAIGCVRAVISRIQGQQRPGNSRAAGLSSLNQVGVALDYLLQVH